MNTQQVPYVESLAVRTAKRGPMREIDSAEVQVDGGLAGDWHVTANRGLTFLSAEQWAQVQRDMERELPWHTRRANVLIAGTTLGHWVGRRVRVGTIEVEILAETEPCGLMDEIQPGLRAALEPECRGGVYGRVRRGGRLSVGDRIELLNHDGTSSTASS